MTYANRTRTARRMRRRRQAAQIELHDGRKTYLTTIRRAVLRIAQSEAEHARECARCGARAHAAHRVYRRKSGGWR